MAISNSVGLKNPRIEVAEPQEISDLSGHFRLSLSVKGMFEDAILLDLLKELERGENPYILEKLLVATSPKLGKPGRLEVLANIYFRLQDSAVGNSMRNITVLIVVVCLIGFLSNLILYTPEVTLMESSKP